MELMLALSLAGILFLGARLLLDQTGSAGAVLARRAGAADDEANRERLLRALVGRAEAPTDTIQPFDGRADTARFDSWCERPAGWLERCRVTLSLERDEAGTTLLAALSTAERYRLAAFHDRSSFGYLDRRGRSGSRWLTTWGRSITMPLAIAVVSEVDTLVLRIGERR